MSNAIRCFSKNQPGLIDLSLASPAKSVKKHGSVTLFCRVHPYGDFRDKGILLLTGNLYTIKEICYNILAFHEPVISLKKKLQDCVICILSTRE